jgi:RecA-family ATPase
MPLDTNEYAAIRAESFDDLLTRTLTAEPAWIEPSILPKRGKLLFGGHAKIGKSFVMLDLARALAAGEAPFANPILYVPKPVRVLLIEKELGLIELQKRGAAVMDDVPRMLRRENLFYVSQEPLLKLDTRQGYETILRLVEEIKPNVLLLDPIGKMHNMDENSNTDISKLFEKLEGLMKAGRDQDMSLVISHHFAKPKMGPDAMDPLSPYNFRGASKWFDDPDTLVTMHKGQEHRSPHKWWTLKTRFETRRGEPPEDMNLSVNEHDDFRVRFKNLVSAGGDNKIIEFKQKKVKTAAEDSGGPSQLCFGT